VLTAFLIFLAAFAALVALEKLVHRRLQEVFLLLTGHTESATLLYSAALFPGVALHEISHALAALLLGVKVRGFSLRAERQTSGVVRLGYVEVLRSDPVRTSLIGAAPFITGMSALVAIGVYAFNLSGLAAAFDQIDFESAFSSLFGIFRANDSLLYIYGVFAIANGMMPSRSDTQAWPPVLLVLGLVGGALFLIGGPGLFDWFSPGATAALRWLGSAFLLTSFINAIVIALLWLLARGLEQLTGRKVTFHR
jgi:hypothetical protein